MVASGEKNEVGEMTYDVLGPKALDYLPCRYGSSKLLFRGPRRNLAKPYMAFLGGTETYGKFVEKPYPALVEERLGATCMNFGVPNGGVDAFVHDPAVQRASEEAQVTVAQVMGAQNMSNRFYSVHPRRNDRFVQASALLRTIYGEVDFADVNFTKHMLSRLFLVSPERFATVREELQRAWVARMRLLLKAASGKTVLLWFAGHAPQSRDQAPAENGDLGADPLFVTREMVDMVRSEATAYVEVACSADAIKAGTEGMIFSEMETPVAQQMMGPAAHAEAAEALVHVLRQLL